MALVNYPYTLTNGTAADASQVQAMFNAVGSVVDGGLDATNIETGTPIAQTSLDGLVAGDSNLLALADHEHILQGWENLAADPTSGNFQGREYFNTSDQTVRLCIDATSSGTFIVIGHMGAADLPNHAANHASGGSDALIANGIDNTMMGRSLVTNTTGSDTAGISDSAWTTVLTGTTFTTTGVNQIVHFTGGFRASETGGSSNAGVGWRVREGSTNYAEQPPALIVANQTTFIPISRYATIPTAGSHTVNLQAYKGSSGTVTVRGTETFASDAIPLTLQVMVG